MPRPEGRRRGASRSSCRRSCFGSSARSRSDRAGADADLPAEAEAHASRAPDRRRPIRLGSGSQGPLPGDSVVWVNTKGKSHTYHYSGSRWYGTTKQGAYMCEADAGAAGYHASKSKTEQQKQM